MKKVTGPPGEAAGNSGLAMKTGESLHTLKAAEVDRQVRGSGKPSETADRTPRAPAEEEGASQGDGRAAAGGVGENPGECFQKGPASRRLLRQQVGRRQPRSHCTSEDGVTDELDNRISTE